MSFHNIAPCSLTFYRSDQSLLLFKFNFFVLNTGLFTFYTTLCSWYDYARLQYGRTIISMVEHSVTGANYFTGANYCKVLMIVRC